MIYYIKFSTDGEHWRSFYAEHVEEVDDSIIAQNVQHPIPSLQKSKKGIRILREGSVTLDCSKDANIAFAYQVVQPAWFQTTC